MVNRKVFHPSYPGAVLTMSFDDGDPVAAFIQNIGEGLSQKEWDAFVQEIRVRLNRELGKVFRGTISPDQFGDAIYQHLLGAHSVSVAAGRQKAGVLGMLSDEDKQVGFFHATQQGQFIDGYVKRIKEKAARYWDEEKGEWKKGVMNRDLQMYASRLRGTASIAFEAHSPDDAQFNWKLGIAEHCEDCINLAADSPHMKGELPVFPGDGGTDCKTNCKCHLVRDDGVACYKPDPGVGRWSEGGSDKPKPADQAAQDADLGPAATGNAIKPVSEAVRYLGSAHDQNIRIAFKTVDGIHSDGALPPIVVGEFTLGGDDQEAEGWFLDSAQVSASFGKRAAMLSLNSGASHPEFTVLHEIGHFLECELWGTGAIVDGQAPGPWADVGQAIVKSERYKQIRKRFEHFRNALANPSFATTWEAIEAFAMYGHYEYLLYPFELWARAYSQFIGTITTRKLIRNQLKEIIEFQRKTKIEEQWDAEDFEPIAAAIYAAMVHEGWIEEAAAEKI